MKTMLHVVRGGASAALVWGVSAVCAQTVSTPGAPAINPDLPEPSPLISQQDLPMAAFGAGSRGWGRVDPLSRLDPGFTAESIGEWQARYRAKTAPAPKPVVRQAPRTVRPDQLEQQDPQWREVPAKDTGVPAER